MDDKFVYENGSWPGQGYFRGSFETSAWLSFLWLPFTKTERIESPTLHTDDPMYICISGHVKLHLKLTIPRAGPLGTMVALYKGMAPGVKRAIIACPPS